jgi:hypothetical protein
MLGKRQGVVRLFWLSDRWLEVGVYPEGPATGHLDTGFLGFPLSYKQMLRWFQSSKLLLRASHAALPT